MTGLEHYIHPCHTEKNIVSQQQLNVPLRCSHCTENFTSYEDFKNHVKKLWPKIKIDCPSCGKRNISTFAAFKMHYSRNHKENLSKYRNPDLMNDIEQDFNSQTDHENSFDYSEDEEMPMSIEDPDDSTLHEEREKMKVQFLAKIMLIAGTHGVPQGIIFKLHRLIFTVEFSKLT